MLLANYCAAGPRRAGLRRGPSGASKTADSPPKAPALSTSESALRKNALECGGGEGDTAWRLRSEGSQGICLRTAHGFLPRGISLRRLEMQHSGREREDALRASRGPGVGRYSRASPPGTVHWDRVGAQEPVLASLLAWRLSQGHRK